MSAPSRSAALNSFPAGQVLQLVELAKSWGVSADTLLGPYGLIQAELERPGARVTLEVLVGLTERTRALTGEPGIGIYLGLQKHISAYGFVGFAAMSASTVREAIEQAVEFAPSLTNAVSLGLNIAGDTAALVVHENVDVGAIRDVALLSLFVGWRQMTHDLTGRQPAGIVELTIPEPHYFSRFEAVLPGTRFDQPINQLILPAAALDVPMTRPDRAAMNLAREQCMEQLARLGFEGSISGRVRRAMVEGDSFRTIDEVAALLAVSERTLKRRLAEQGSSFTEMLKEERQLRALHLLRATELSLDEIADRLGYSNASSLSRAFARWTGQTPAAYRRARPGAGVLASP